jgi:hypothetical protein
MLKDKHAFENYTLNTYLLYPKFYSNWSVTFVPWRTKPNVLKTPIILFYRSHGANEDIKSIPEKKPLNSSHASLGKAK